MTNPADKIQQVLSDANTAIRTYEWTAVTDAEETIVVDSEDSRKVVKEALIALLDVIIAEMENDIRYKDSMQGGVIAEQCNKLKEVRTSLQENHG